MRQELQNIEYIERYLENSLSLADKRKFEQHLKEDAQFRAAVHLQRQLITQVKEQAFLQEIAQQHTTFLSKEQQQSKRFWWLLPIGGVLVMALIVAWWYNQQTAPVVESPLTEVVVKDAAPIAPPEGLGQKPEKLAPALQVPYTTERLSANRRTTITFKGTASTLTIPKRALVNAAGEVVTGTYELHYRSLDNLAAMATAGFPLLTAGSAAEGIASIGAFEIKAFQKGAPLFLATGKALILDYELQERAHQSTLYHLEEDSKTWKASKQALVLPKRGAYEQVVDSVAFKEAERVYVASLKAANPEQPQRRKDTLQGTITMMPKGLEKISDATPPQPNQYLVRHYKNPKLVRALRLGSFGVYNCGKAYQVKNQVVIAAQYTNQQKVVIENARTLSVIDMDYKAAYSFQPDQFLCNSQANNVFLLWTQTGNLYAFVKKAQVNLQTGTYSFQMENLSERVQNSRDLKLYLKRLQNKIDKK
ncbi:MAG: hypothetical protein ACRBFS_23455 [Aureispira sp.]